MLLAATGRGGTWLAAIVVETGKVTAGAATAVVITS